MQKPGQEIWVLMVMMFMGILFSVVLQGMFNLGSRMDDVTRDLAVIKFCLEHDIAHCS